VYPGPIGSVISAGFFGSEFVPLAQASSLCGACKEACPVDIDLPKLLTRVRAGQTPVASDRLSVRRGERLSWLSKFVLKIYSRIGRSPRLFTGSQKLGALGSRLVSPFGDYVPLPAFTGWGYSKDLPRFARKPFRHCWENLLKEQSTAVREQVEMYTKKKEESENKSGVAISRDLLELSARFADELIRVNGNVIHTNRVNITDQMIDFLNSRRITQIHLEPNVVDEAALQKAGILIRHAPDAALRAGVTRAVCGLADTGSILVVDGGGHPLKASLLPEIHIAVLCASDILPSLPEALALSIVQQSRASVVITGPSRTADIEMSLTIGMHGPRELYVFLVDQTARTLVDD
jgi:L-lactate utilization protein LutC